LSRNTVQGILNTVQLSRSTFKERSVDKRQRPAPNKRAPAAAFAQPLTDGGSPSLWFDPPIDLQDRRHQLTRERVVAEALAVIAHDGVQALTMRRLAARLGVVPGALYHHVRNKERLHDLVLDNVLAEVDVHLDPSPDWTDQLKVLAHRLRQVLEDHPGVAGILKTRDPLGPHSLALAKAFLGPLQAAGFADDEAGLAFFLLVDYTIGFAVGPPTSVNEQRVRDPATRTQLHQFFRSLPPTASPPWSPSANTSGSTTATSGSPPAWRCWSMGWSMRAPPPLTSTHEPTDDHPEDPTTASGRWLSRAQRDDARRAPSEASTSNAPTRSDTMNQTGPTLDPTPLRSPTEPAPAQTAMKVRPILSHELVVGDYLGVISSMHQPDHFRRVEKLEYIDADLGRPHLKYDIFYLEAAHMGPVIAWCHGIAGPLILPAGDVHVWLDVPQERQTADEQDGYWGVLSGEEEPLFSFSRLPDQTDTWQQHRIQEQQGFWQRD
jgi:AcrR family transcriptional regulator